MDGQAPSGSADEGASGRQSGHRHQETGLTATRSRVLRVLRLSVLLGRCGVVGHGRVPRQPDHRGQDRRGTEAHGTHPTSTSNDCHLRSSNAVIGHHIEATDGEIGHLEDLLIDDHTWAIRYLVVNTSNWWSGRRVLVAPHWVRDVSWSEAKVSVDLTRRTVTDLPLYESIAQLQSTS